MDWVKLKEKIPQWLNRYKYLLLILLLGVVLLSIPEKDEVQEHSETAASQPAAEESEEERLEQILSQIQGAGRVEVMLTYATGPETVYQTNEDRSENSDSSTLRRDTVMTSDAQRTETGLIRQVNPAVYLGAVVVCQGADRASVKLATIEAVSKVTDLGADQICVQKMK